MTRTSAGTQHPDFKTIMSRFSFDILFEWMRSKVFDHTLVNRKIFAHLHLFFKHTIHMRVSNGRVFHPGSPSDGVWAKCKCLMMSMNRSLWIDDATRSFLTSFSDDQYMRLVNYEGSNSQKNLFKISGTTGFVKHLNIQIKTIARRLERHIDSFDAMGLLTRCLLPYCVSAGWCVYASKVYFVFLGYQLISE